MPDIHQSEAKFTCWEGDHFGPKVMSALGFLPSSHRSQFSGHCGICLLAPSQGSAKVRFCLYCHVTYRKKVDRKKQIESIDSRSHNSLVTHTAIGELPFRSDLELPVTWISTTSFFFFKEFELVIYSHTVVGSV